MLTLKQRAQGFLLAFYEHYISKNPDILHEDFAKFKNGVQTQSYQDAVTTMQNLSAETINQLQEGVEVMKNFTNSDWDSEWRDRIVEDVGFGVLEIRKSQNNSIFIVTDENIEGGYKMLKYVRH
ncbi:unnamed protein product [Caenorhabditis angaria]|uniref:Uncharacterized protein n=1 Tax=Caenorhabditis angaria TaxID=860376 RepID=A0A9P1IRC4_9PELO|nr:unnamed protein product [Caenorhabditis angaria]